MSWLQSTSSVFISDFWTIWLCFADLSPWLRLSWRAWIRTRWPICKKPWKSFWQPPENSGTFWVSNALEMILFEACLPAPFLGTHLSSRCIGLQFCRGKVPVILRKPLVDVLGRILLSLWAFMRWRCSLQKSHRWLVVFLKERFSLLSLPYWAEMICMFDLEGFRVKICRTDTLD